MIIEVSNQRRNQLFSLDAKTANYWRAALKGTHLASIFAAVGLLIGSPNREKHPWDAVRRLA